MAKIAFTAICLLLVLGANAHTATAHQPQYVGTEAAIHIPDADTSFAYYGELTGQPVVYTIVSDKEFSLYLNILSPYLPDAKKDFSVRITDATGSLIATLKSPATNWQLWYEEFAGDTYWKGPEFKKTLPAGTYAIEVSNPGDSGKYVLAPGEAEVFTLAGTPHTVRQLYLVKTLFFDKPWYSIFEGVIGKLLLGCVAILLITVGAVILLFRRVKKRRLSRN